MNTYIHMRAYVGKHQIWLKYMKLDSPWREERERERDGDKEVFEKTIPKYFPKLIDTKVQIQIAQDTSSKKNKMHAWSYQRYISKKKKKRKNLTGKWRWKYTTDKGTQITRIDFS